jgi:hypothetical protein
MWEPRRLTTLWASTVCYRVSFTFYPEEKKPLGRPRHRRGNNITINVKEIGWSGMDWIDLAQDRDQWKTLVNTVMKVRVS